MNASNPVSLWFTLISVMLNGCIVCDVRIDNFSVRGAISREIFRLQLTEVGAEVGSIVGEREGAKVGDVVGESEGD